MERHPFSRVWKNIHPFIIANSFKSLFILSFLLLLTACSDSDDGGGAESELYLERQPNLDIPAGHSGTVQGNVRSYSVNTNGYKVAVQTNGLTGQVTLQLTDEQIDINANTLTTFNSTFLPDTYVSIDIVNQPFLQECSFAGVVNNGTISADATLILTLDCIDSNAPAAPFITNIYSNTIDAIDVEWEDAIDRDTTVNLLSYTVYWSLDRTEVENKTATTIDIPAGNLHTQLTSLSADTEYFLAIEGRDNDGNLSGLSEIQSLTTLATPNVTTGTPFHVLEQADVNNTGADWIVPETAFNTTPQTGDVLVTVTDTEYLIVKVDTVTLDTGTYTFVVEAGNIGDIFQQLSLSSNIAMHDIPEQNAIVTANTKIALFKSPLQVSICRPQEDGNVDVQIIPEDLLTAYELSQILLSPIKRFEPRVINKTYLELNGFTPALKGSIEFKGDVEIGVDIGFKITDKIEGVYSCKLAGFPKVKERLIITPSGFPIYQEIAFDIELKLNLEASAGVTAIVIPTARASVRSKLAYNEATDTWDPTSSTSAGFKIKSELKVSAELKASAAIIPSVSTTFYKTATAGVSAVTGVNGRLAVSVTSEEDPIFKLYDYPALLDDFTVDADVRFNLDADLSLFGYTIFRLPTWEVYKTPSLSLFDTPLVCTNQGATRENCKTSLKISTASHGKRYPLEIFFADGKFIKSFDAETNKNKVDIGSIDWQVSPNNGYFEIDKYEPHKATFVAHDDRAYTIVASAHGVLGKPARKFAKFFTNSECTFGLGRELPAEYEQYLLSYGGYLLPRDADVADPEKDMYEICSDSDGVTSTTYYAGQKNGPETSRGGKTVTVYENGMVKSYFDEREYLNEFYESTYVRFDIIPIPGAEYNASVPVHDRYFTSMVRFPENRVPRYLEYEAIVDTDNLTRKEIHYYPNGEKKSVTLYSVELIGLTQTETSQFHYSSYSAQPYFVNGEKEFYLDGEYEYREPISSLLYWDNGKPQADFNYRTGLWEFCGYKNPDDPNESPAKVYENGVPPGSIYYCDPPRPID